MHQGHRGANHPVKRLADYRVEITSMNHGFAVEERTPPQRSAKPTSACSTAAASWPGLSILFSPQRAPRGESGPQDASICSEKFVVSSGDRFAESRYPARSRLPRWPSLAPPSGCVNTRVFTETELGEVGRGCGLAAGEVMQEPDHPRYLFLYAIADPRQLRCVRRWARRHHMDFAYIEAVDFTD